jgi:hypothetical protein
LRQPFPGEADEEAAETPPGHAPIVLVRQVEPGARTRGIASIPADLLPLPDDERCASASSIRPGQLRPRSKYALFSKNKLHAALREGSKSWRYSLDGDVDPTAPLNAVKRWRASAAVTGSPSIGGSDWRPRGSNFTGNDDDRHRWH